MPPKLISEIKGIKVSNEKNITTLRILAVIYTYQTSKKIPKKMEWDEIKKLLNKEDFLSIIKNVNGEDLPESLVNFVQNEMTNPDNKWDLEVIKRAGQSVGIMAGWVEAMMAYSTIVNNVQPLTDEINELAKKKNELEKEFENVINEITNLENNISQLKTLKEIWKKSNQR